MSFLRDALGHMVFTSGGGLVAPEVDGGGSSDKALLQSTDLEYLGMFKFPQRVLSGSTRYVSMPFSMGCLSGRRSGGTLSLFVTGGRTIGDPVYEVSVPATTSLSVGSAPTASLLNNYGTQIYGGRRPNFAGEQSGTHGIHWDEEGQRLFWGYGAIYNGSAADPSIGFSVLNHDGAGSTTPGSATAAAYGPFRPQLHRGYMCGYMQTVPEWFREHLPAGETLVIGNPTRANNATSPFGADMIAFIPPTTSTPPDTASSFNPGTYTIAAKKLLFHDYTHPQARTTNAISCDGGAIGAPPTAVTRPFEPVFAGGSPGYLLDWMDSGCWIDMPSKHGIVFVGQLVDTIEGFAYATDGMPHNWYGTNPCSHGHNAGSTHQGQGPGATTLVNYMWIYDPEDLVGVAQGSVNPWGVTPTEVLKAHTLGFCLERRQLLYRFGGMYFDPVASRLYLVENGVYNEPVAGESAPVCHVFQVN